MTPPGTLYVVATPIGNLEDLTFRALRILREVDIVAAEDTRRTAKLLARYEIRKPLVSVRQHNEAQEGSRLLAKIAAGQSVALVSDAGTPGIADPGARLVRMAREQAIAVVPIPGPSAITAALSVSGLDTDEFVFMGFAPASGVARIEWLERLSRETRTAVFFEAPHRIRRTIAELVDVYIKRQIYVHREISKIHEEFVVWPNTTLHSSIRDEGEFTVVIPPAASSTVQEISASDLVDIFGRLTDHAGFDDGMALRITACLSGLPERVAAKLIKKERISVKQQKSSVP